jgi:uncharacterized membrane protein (DUF4010 family)
VNPEISGNLARLAVALLVGLLIGLDRERAEARKARAEFAGVRTFPLIALLGCVPMLLIDSVGPWLVVASFLVVGAIVVIAYQRAAAEHVGATTETAAIATFLLGALAGDGQLLLAGAGGVAVAVLLVFKPKLEGFSRAITPEELTAALELAVITVIVLPLLPDRGYGPWQTLNPREIWLVVVLVAGLSFAGFVAVRLLGEGKGLAVTGALGGLASSTAVTVAMADLARESDTVARPAAGAAVLASTVMALRVLVLAGITNAGIVPRLLPVALGMALAGAVAARLITRKDRQAAERRPQLKNPFSLRQAAFFGAVYAAIVLAVRAAQEYLGEAGLFAAAVLGSVADVDAATIAFTNMGAGDPPWRTGAALITVAAVSNTLVKLGIGAARGGMEFRRNLALGLGTMAVAAAAIGTIVYLTA